ncbi:YybS family protein [Aeribacillus sp. FSL K6-2848]|uniref:YybS family protein n=1 Tax=unclassified Aeribacillus TaxID=2640495 RepID=UPI002871C464|nr:YybS family protein [Aeribacillus pallidus]
MKRTNVLTEGAIFVAIYTVFLLITLYVPILSVISIFFLSTPFIIFGIRHGIKQSFVLLLASIVMTFLVGSIVSLPIGLMFSVTGIIMAYFYRQKRQLFALIGGTISLLINFVLDYALSIVFLGVDLFSDVIQQTKSSVRETLAAFPSMDEEMKKTMMEQMNEQFDLLMNLLPSMFVIVSFMLAAIIHILNIGIIKRLKLNVGTITPFRDWKFPKSIIWYYLIATLLMLINLPKESFLNIALYNIVFVLQTVLLIQGFSFIFYFCHVKKLSKAVPVLIVIGTFILPILLYPVRILGIIDLGFNLREKIR